MSFPEPPWKPAFDGAGFGRLAGIDVIESPSVPEGTAYVFSGPGGPPYIIKGIRPRTLMEDVAYEARQIVRRGIAAAHPWLRLP